MSTIQAPSIFERDLFELVPTWVALPTRVFLHLLLITALLVFFWPAAVLVSIRSLSDFCHYRGEALVRHATPRLKSQSSRFPRLWVFFPLRAIPIPMAARRVTVTLETAFACGEKLLAESHVAFAFVPTSDDRTPMREEAIRPGDDDGDKVAVRLIALPEARVSGLQRSLPHPHPHRHPLVGENQAAPTSVYSVSLGV